MKRRKIVQLVTIPDTSQVYGRVIALCDDSTVFKAVLRDDHVYWTQFPPIPQDGDKL